MLKIRLITYLLTAILRQLDPHSVKVFLDDVIDKLEDMTKEPLALEALGLLRMALSIPDDIGGDPD